MLNLNYHYRGTTQPRRCSTILERIAPSAFAGELLEDGLACRAGIHISVDRDGEQTPWKKEGQ